MKCYCWNLSRYIPNLTLDGTIIKMVEINLIQNCLAGYTFILGSSDKVVCNSLSVERKKRSLCILLLANSIYVQYQFGEKLQGLLESTGAKYLHIDEFCPNSQVSAGEPFYSCCLYSSENVRGVKCFLQQACYKNWHFPCLYMPVEFCIS